MRYFISYGFLGGERNGSTFRRLMGQAGHQLSDSTAGADVVIAHSAGCWCLPPKLNAKLIIYVGIPLANPVLLTMLKNNFAINKHFVRTLNIKAAVLYYWRALFYGLSQPRRNFSIMKNAKNSKLSNYKNCKVVMIRNRSDYWSRPRDFESFTNQHKDWVYLSLNGTHDDIWERPKEYVSVIGALAKGIGLL